MIVCTGHPLISVTGRAFHFNQLDWGVFLQVSKRKFAKLILLVGSLK